MLARAAATARGGAAQLARRHLVSAPKATTGIVGLPVDPNARSKLLALYRETLSLAPALQAGLKDSVLQIATYRLSVAERTTVAEEIEEEIDCGQIEELVEQAEDELGMVKAVIEMQQRQPA